MLFNVIPPFKHATENYTKIPHHCTNVTGTKARPDPPPEVTSSSEMRSEYRDHSAYRTMRAGAEIGTKHRGTSSQRMAFSWFLGDKYDF